MNLINKWWKRLLISLIVGGLISETIIVLTYGKMGINAFLIGIVLYLILSVVYGVLQKK